MKKKDPSRFHKAGLSTKKDIEYRIKLENYFKNSLGTNVEKLLNFAKYVPRQEITKFISRYGLFKKILNVQGSIVECGVLFGGV